MAVRLAQQLHATSAGLVHDAQTTLAR
jgi:hypothetical protein